MADFFERMERKLNIQMEYEKLEELILNEPRIGSTVEKSIEANFRKWKFRKNFISFDELRHHLGFDYGLEEEDYYFVPIDRKIELPDFLLYCEMMLNMCLVVLNGKTSTTSFLQEVVRTVIHTIQYDLEELNFEFRKQKDGRILVVQKNAAATAVADLVPPELADVLIEYNHHLLKGNIEVKKMILKKLADSLEPKRAALKAINKTVESDFFFMVNKMNVRHNNCDPNDPGRYVQKFAVLSAEDQEKWYDEIYQQGLMAYLLMEQEKREKRIAAFKA